MSLNVLWRGVQPFTTRPRVRPGCVWVMGASGTPRPSSSTGPRPALVLRGCPTPFLQPSRPGSGLHPLQELPDRLTPPPPPAEARGAAPPPRGASDLQWLPFAGAGGDPSPLTDSGGPVPLRQVSNLTVYPLNPQSRALHTSVPTLPFSSGQPKRGCAPLL